MPDLCDHDVCMCGEEYTDGFGRAMCIVPHPGDYREWFRLDEYYMLGIIDRNARELREVA